MMTEMEFKQKVKEIRPAYIKACEDYLDAMERLDFKSATSFGMSAVDLLGMDAMEFMMRKLEENEDTMSEFSEKYEAVTEELTERIYGD